VLSNREQEDLADVLELVDALETKWTTLSVSARKRLAARRTAGEAIAVVTARQLGMGARISADIAQLRQSPGGIAPAAFVTGADLIALGERPGPKFKGLLDEVYDSQLEGRVHNREEALDEARRRIANAKN
jgi:hypothetical protein